MINPAAPEAIVEAGWFPAAAVTALGRGHINATWLVVGARGSRGAGRRFVLQALSAAVFPDPVQVMENVVQVIGHVNRVAPGRVPRLVSARNGGAFHRDGDGTVWRLWEYVEHARTVETLANEAQAAAAGRAFGDFQRWLRDLPGALPDPIPGFMQLDHYLARLDAVCASMSTGTVRDEIGFVGARRDLAGAFASRDRFIHGDCKVNNLLFRLDQDEVVCILDLDTVMRGHWAWDAGDLARSAAGGAEGFSVTRYAAAMNAFREAAGIVAGAEAFVLAPRYVTLMLGVRFLTDHLEGDRYFRVGHPGENLVRAREQFARLADMERLETAMLAALA
jgi:Ser/Thr protein kinase RdoA (MazF antagonist)